MRVFIQAKNGTPTDQDHFNAYIGFREMGFETVFLKPLRNWQKAKYGKLQPGDVACFYETDSQQKIQRPNYSRAGGFDRMRKLL